MNRHSVQDRVVCEKSVSSRCEFIYKVRFNCRQGVRVGFVWANSVQHLIIKVGSVECYDWEAVGVFRDVQGRFKQFQGVSYL